MVVLFANLKIDPMAASSTQPSVEENELSCHGGMRQTSTLLGGVFHPLPFQSFATNCSISVVMFSKETLSADIYVIMCASLATVAFSINFTQMLVIVFLSRCWQSLYLLNGCVCGMVTAGALMYHAVVENSPEVRPDHLAAADSHGTHDSCNIVSAMLTIIMLIGNTANLTAIIAHKFLASVMPGCLNSVSRNRLLSLLLSTIATAQVAIFCISLTQPWSSNPHTRICLPPYQWGEAYSRSVAGTYCVQMLICAVLLLELTMNSKREGDGKTVASLDVQVLWLKYLLLAVSTVPFAALTIYHSMAIQNNLCFVVKDSVQVWTLVATVLLASALPAVHVLSDQVICRGTLYLLQRLLCLSRDDHALDGVLLPSMTSDEAYRSGGVGATATSDRSPRGHRRFDHLPTREQFILRMSGQPLDCRNPFERQDTGNRSHHSAQQQIHQQQTDVMY